MTGYGAPQPQQRSGQQLPLFDLIGAGLGILSFVWGFLDWFNIDHGNGDSALKGYQGGGAAAIGLSLLAGAVAAGPLLDKTAKNSLVPLGASVGSLLVTLGVMVAGKLPKGVADYKIQIGLILMLITALAQVVLFVLGWLQANGKIMTGASSAGGGQWGGGQQQWGGYQQQPQQYSQQQATAATQQYGQQQYGQPQQQPQQPQQPQYGQPQHPQQPPSNPYGQG
ncbi:MAG TPA: DUF5336 domain-containing protein [Jatrophihabitantaceae bacterium]